MQVGKVSQSERENWRHSRWEESDKWTNDGRHRLSFCPHVFSFSSYSSLWAKSCSCFVFWSTKATQCTQWPQSGLVEESKQKGNVREELGHTYPLDLDFYSWRMFVQLVWHCLPIQLNLQVMQLALAWTWDPISVSSSSKFDHKPSITHS